MSWHQRGALALAPGLWLILTLWWWDLNAPQWATVGAAGFVIGPWLHTDLLHLGVNTALWLVFGGLLVRGGMKVRCIWLVSLVGVLSGVLLHNLFDPRAADGLAGASSAVFALVAASLTLAAGQLTRVWRWVLYGAVVLEVLSGLMVSFGDWAAFGTSPWAHVGGALGGGLLAWQLRRSTGVDRDGMVSQNWSESPCVCTTNLHRCICDRSAVTETQETR